MRFGRTPAPKLTQRLYRPSRTNVPPNRLNFFRFGRGIKDNFIRFGRGAQENFIRFGRGGKESFIRFGRPSPDDFLRSGKSERESFIRFGKADNNFMRFGREKFENEENLEPPEYVLVDAVGRLKEMPDIFQRIAKFQKQNNFIRLGKNGNQKESRNGTNFLRFGKKGGDANKIFEDEGDTDADDNQEGGADSYVRIKRSADTDNFDNDKESAEVSAVNEDSSPHSQKRSTRFFERTPDYFPRSMSSMHSNNAWESLGSLGGSRFMPPFFPVSPKFHNTFVDPYFHAFAQGSDWKRNQGGSNFIRFG